MLTVYELTLNKGEAVLAYNKKVPHLLEGDRILEEPFGA